MGQTFDFTAAAVLVKVVEAGSFRGAARALGMPKSSVSRRVAELEARLGVRLLQRTTRRVGLTDAGKVYFDRASAGITTLEEAEDAARDLVAEPKGTLRVTSSVNFGILVLPHLLAELLAEHPALRVDVELSDRHVDLIEERFDVAIRAGHLPDSSLVAQHLGGTKMLVVASPTYLRRRRRPEVPADLAEHACLVFGSAETATWTFADGRRQVDVQVRGPLCANSFFVLREAAAAGLGIARVPALLAERAIAERRLVSLLDAHAPPAVPLHALYPSARYLSPKVRVFVEMLRARVGSGVKASL
jgi:DNA-binding transcriptional LysR family regulator